MGYLLHGQNTLLLDERVAELRNELDPGNLGTTIIDVQMSSAEAIAAASQAMPFFGGRRIVVLVNPIATSKRDSQGEDAGEGQQGGRIRWPELMRIFQAAPPTTEFIVRHDGSLTQTHYSYKGARSLGWTVESFPVKYGPELLAWVQERSRTLDVNIEPTAATELLNLLYPTSWQSAGKFATDTPDMRLIATEIDKLSNAAIDGVVTAETVRELVADRSGYTAFRLNEVTFGGQTEAALLELHNVLESGEPAERIISQLASEAAALASARAGAGMPRKALAEASGTSEARLYRLQERASGFGGDAHRVIAEAIRAADAGVKTGHTAETSATITPLVADIAEVIRRAKRPQRSR